MTKRKRPEDKLKAGRPSGYKPEYCDRVIEMGRLGYTKAMMARDLDVARMTLDNWAAANPEFLDAMTRARDLALAFMEEKGLAGLDMAGFNSSLYSKLMSCMFPGDYSEHKKVEMTGKDGAPLQTAGVMVVGAVMTPEEWTAAAKTQQEGLTKGV